MGAGGLRLRDMVEEPARDCSKPRLQGGRGWDMEIKREN